VELKTKEESTKKDGYETKDTNTKKLLVEKKDKKVITFDGSYSNKQTKGEKYQ